MIAFFINCAAFICVITSGLFLAVYLYFRWVYTYWEKNKVCYVPGEFIYGSFKKSTTLKTTAGEELAEWHEYFKGKGQKYFGVYFFHQPVLTVIDLNLIRNIFTTDFNHFSGRGLYVNKEDDPLSAHIFSLTGSEWKNIRQKLTPTFTTGKLKMMFQVVSDCTDELIAHFDELANKGEPIDIKKSFAKYTINVIGSCAFGIDCNSFKDPNSQFVQIGENFFKLSNFEKLKLLFVLCFPNVSKYLRIKMTGEKIDSFYKEVVKETIEYRERNNITRNDFMQLLIQLKSRGVLDNFENESAQPEKSKMDKTPLTLDEVTAQAFLFFLAGYETTSITLTYCLYELAKNQEIQEKARQEINCVLQKHNGNITYDAIKEMHYLERVILETLRKHPSLPMTQRSVTKEYRVPGSNIVLKEGSLVFISVRAIHYDPEYYPNPEVFDPDRFTEENKATRPDYTFLAFGEGPRTCIGLRFGMMQTKIGICKLLQHNRYTINAKTIEPIVLDPNQVFLNATLNPIWIDSHKIDSLKDVYPIS